MSEATSAPAQSSAPVDSGLPADFGPIPSQPSKSDAPLSQAELNDIALEKALARIKEGKSPEPEEGEEDYVPKEQPKTEEDDESLEEAVEEIEKEEAKKPEPKIAKFKTKNGEIEVDLTDEGEVTRLIQKGIGATETFEEAALMRKNAENFIASLKDNPFKLLSHPSLALDVRKLAEDYLWEQIQLDKMTPEEKAFKEREARLKAFEEAEEMRVKQENQRREEAKKAKQREYWTKVISEGLQKHGLPKNAWTMEETAKRMKVAIENGDTGVTPDDVMPGIKSDWITMFKSQIGSLDGESLSGILGKDVVNKINKNEIKKYRESKFDNKVEAPAPTKSAKTYRSMEEMQHSLRNKYK